MMPEDDAQLYCASTSEPVAFPFELKSGQGHEAAILIICLVLAIVYALLPAGK